MVSGKYDYVSLTACATKLKQRFEDEDQVYITANPGTEYQIIMNVIDALRQTAAGVPMFANVNFKVPR